MLDSWFLSVKMQKHSARSSLQVMVGSKIYSPWVSLAALFLSEHLFIKDRLPWGAFRRGFSFGAMAFIHFWASRAHSLGSQHPLSLSMEQSSQIQSAFLVCVAAGSRFLSLADMLIRSTTLEASCLFNKHFDGVFLISWGAKVR